MNNYQSIIGKHFIAQKGIEKHKILYTFKFGGGIKGGYVKAGDVLKITGLYNDVDTVSFSTDKTLYRMAPDFFADPQYTIQID